MSSLFNIAGNLLTYKFNFEGNLLSAASSDFRFICCSVRECAYHCGTSLGPIRWRSFRGQADLENEVGRMACGGQCSLPLHGAVKWSHVDTLCFLFRNQDRLKPDHWAVREQNLWFAFPKDCSVPFKAFHVHTLNIESFSWRYSVFLILDNLKVQSQFINWEFFHSSVVLKCSSHETLREEELVDPIEVWESRVNPKLEELQAVSQVFNVTTQSFHRWVTFGHPQLGDNTKFDLHQSLFKLRWQQYLSLDCKLQVHEWFSDLLDQTIEPSQLLCYHWVHTLFVQYRVLFLGSLDVERLRNGL